MGRTEGVYNATAPTLNDGGEQTFQLDSAGNLKVTAATLTAGEDLTNDVTKVEQRFGYAIAFGAGTTVIKASAGFLHRFVVSTNGGTFTIYDNTASTSTSSASRIFDFDNSSVSHENHEINTTFSGLIVGSLNTSTRITFIYR